MSVAGHVRARTVAGLWEGAYHPLLASGEITEEMIVAAARDLRLLEEATRETRENEAFRNGESVVPACGWAAQGQLKLLSNYLQEEGVRAAVPGWQDNFPKNLRFLVDVTTPPGSELSASNSAQIVPPQEVVERLGAGRAVELVTIFYDLMLREPELRIYFDGTRTDGIPVDVSSLMDHFLQFVVAAFTGVQEYKGRPLREALREAHQRLGISIRHWKMTVGIFVTAMNMVEVDEPTIKAVVVGIAPFEEDVVALDEQEHEQFA